MMMIDRAILREIQWLRLQQQSSASPCSSGDHAPSHQPVPSSQSAQQLVLGPGHLVDELRLLRRRRDALECRMASLQSSRRHLMCQLDSLMTLLKASDVTSHLSVVTIRISMLCGNTAYCAKLRREDLSRYSNKVEPVVLRQYPYYHCHLTNKAMSQ